VTSSGSQLDALSNRTQLLSLSVPCAHACAHTHLRHTTHHDDPSSYDTSSGGMYHKADLEVAVHVRGVDAELLLHEVPLVRAARHVVAELGEACGLVWRGSRGGGGGVSRGAGAGGRMASSNTSTYVRTTYTHMYTYTHIHTPGRRAGPGGRRGRGRAGLPHQGGCSA
jgi:hypothetical protein